MGWFGDITRAIDPTTATGRRNLVYGGSLGMGAIGDKTLGSPLGKAADREAADRSARERAAGYAADTQRSAERLRELGSQYASVDENTQEVKDITQGTPDQPGTIKQGQDALQVGADKGNRMAAAAYARRGLKAGSGYEVADQQSRTLAAAAERQRARETAIKAAVGEVQGRIAGQGAIEGLAVDPMMALTNAAQQRAMLEYQRQQEAIASWLELGGLAGYGAYSSLQPSAANGYGASGYGQWSGANQVASSPPEIY